MNDKKESVCEACRKEEEASGLTERREMERESLWLSREE